MDFQDQISLDSDEDERQEDNLTLEQETQIFYTHCEFTLKIIFHISTN